MLKQVKVKMTVLCSLMTQRGLKHLHRKSIGAKSLGVANATPLCLRKAKLIDFLFPFSS